MEKATTTQLKKQNRQNVFRTIYERQKTCKQDIAQALGLSLPTVAQLLKELQNAGLIEKRGTFASSGGRRPEAIVLVPDSRVAIGVEVTKHHLQLVCVDLYGRVLAERRLRMDYESSTTYYTQMGAAVTDFVAAHKLPQQKILGVGIAVQGVISADGQTVAYGKILDCTGETLANFAQSIPYPCALLHDSESAARAELWFSNDIRDAVYLSLSKHLGSAVILGGAIHRGEGIGSGLLEHMVYQPGGRLCYCGKKGCVEAYCSTDALLGDGDADSFFEKAHHNGTAQAAQWQEYLEILSSVIDNAHMLIDCDVVLGGHIGPYILPEDVRRLNDLARQKCALPEQRDYIRVGKCPAAVVAIGAGLHYISTFLDEI